MGTWETFYDGVFDAIETLVGAVTGINQVVNGKKFVLKKTPCVVVNPGEFDMDSEMGGGRNVKFTVVARWELIVVIRETEPDDWFDEVVSKMGAVLDAFVADPEVGSTLIDSTPMKFSPGSVELGGKVYYGGTIRFEGLAEWTP